MSFDHEKILGWVTDRLCGELGETEADELGACLAGRPDLAGEAARLEASWKALARLDTARPLDAGEHKKLINRIFERLAGSRELVDEEIEHLAAAGREEEVPKP